MTSTLLPAVEDFTFLEELFGQDIHCEATHIPGEHPPCSDKVTHRFFTRHDPSILVCANAAGFVYHSMARWMLCSACLDEGSWVSTRVCWRIHPV